MRAAGRKTGRADRGARLEEGGLEGKGSTHLVDHDLGSSRVDGGEPADSRYELRHLRRELEVEKEHTVRAEGGVDGLGVAWYVLRADSCLGSVGVWVAISRRVARWEGASAGPVSKIAKTKPGSR